MAGDISLSKLGRAGLIWINLPTNYLGIIRILWSFLGIFAGLLVWKATNLARLSIQLSPLRFGERLIELPIPPQSWDVPIFTTYYLSCAFLLLPFRTPWFAALSATILTYYCCLDIGCDGHSILLTDIFLLALVFSGRSDNATRRLIQIEVCFCYGLAAVHKFLFADYYQGFSLRSWLADGKVLKPFFAELISHVAIPLSGWAAFSLFSGVVEATFVIGFWFKKTRRLTVVAAMLFHLGIFIAFPLAIMFFSVVMWTGLLAFVGRDKYWFADEEEVGHELAELSKSSDDSKKQTALVHPWRNGLALVFMLLMFVIPARMFFWQGRTNEDISSMDRAPLTFAMFLQQETVVRARIYYKERSGPWQLETIHTRFREMSSDNHLYAAANAFIRSHPGVQLVRVELDYIANGRRLESKTLIVDRTVNPPVTRFSVHVRPLVHLVFR